MEWQGSGTGALELNLQLFLIGPEKWKGHTWGRLASVSPQVLPEPYLAYRV